MLVLFGPPVTYIDSTLSELEFLEVISHSHLSVNVKDYKTFTADS